MPESTSYRWVIVACAAAVLALVMGLMVNGLSVFFTPLEQEFHWSRGAISLINTLGLVGVGLGGIAMGRVADRVNIRTIGIFAVIVMGICVALASQADQLWQFYLLFFLAGALGASAVYAPLVATVGSWFPVGAGLAIGLASAGQALGQGGVPLVLAWMIEAMGWRGALLAYGVGTLALLLPVVLALRPAPALPRGTAAATEPAPVLSPGVTVVALSVAILLCCTCMAVPLVHLVPLIESLCITGSDAGGVLFAMLVAGIAGRIFFGKLADMIGPIPAYMAASLWQTVGVFAFTQITDLSLFYVFAPIYGFGYAGVMTGVLVTARALTPAANRATLMGVIFLFGWLGHGLGGYQGGLFYDLTGGYTVSFANAAAAGVLNLMILISLWLVTRRRIALAA